MAKAEQLTLFTLLNYLVLTFFLAFGAFLIEQCRLFRRTSLLTERNDGNIPGVVVLADGELRAGPDFLAGLRALIVQVDFAA